MSLSAISNRVSGSLGLVENYQLTAGVFMKLLSLIYFAAFMSLVFQVTGLVGENGILPFNESLDYYRQEYGELAWLYMPTLFWINCSDLALCAASMLGCIFSLQLFIGFRQTWSLIALFFLYLSLFHAGQTFLTFQWDTLLLEAGFLSIFLSRGPTHLLVFLFHWLLFRLRFMSGISKLASGDPIWSNLTTLNYYFETQPLPHAGAWYFHQLPEWMLQSGVVLVFFTELIVPFFIFLPRKFRIFAAMITIIMQLLIIATSNHNWINLLTIALCLFLLDDDVMKKIVPRGLYSFVSIKADDKGFIGKSMRNLALPVFTLLILTSSVTVFTQRFGKLEMPAPVEGTTTIVRLWGLGHIFHIFPTMQAERHELVIEGSYDGKHWESYAFKYKPGQLDRMPPFIVPHQPRLDWLMWFVPPQHAEMMYWFDRFLYRLRQGSDGVLDLIEYNPFEKSPPKYLRVLVYRYRFTSTEERKLTGNWWKREYMGLFPYVKPRFP